MGDSQLIQSLEPEKYVDAQFGVPTITDILKELEKPGRDPRPEFTTAIFKEGVEKLSDLAPEMILEGVVTNVAAFGAFVDIGVHQDGLVHISALSNTFVKDPHAIVKAGQVVKVKVIAVDEAQAHCLDDAPNGCACKYASNKTNAAGAQSTKSCGATHKQVTSGPQSNSTNQ